MDKLPAELVEKIARELSQNRDFSNLCKTSAKIKDACQYIAKQKLKKLNFKVNLYLDYVSIWEKISYEISKSESASMMFVAPYVSEKAAFAAFIQVCKRAPKPDYIDMVKFFLNQKFHGSSYFGKTQEETIAYCIKLAKTKNSTVILKLLRK